MLEIKTPRLSLESATRAHAQALLGYYERNKSHLAATEPLRDAAFYTISHWRERTGQMEQEWADARALYFCILTENTLVGVCNFTNIVRGVFQACYLGYSLDREYEGQGIMSEALQAGIQHMFDDQHLHRIMANHLPDNHRSAALLHRLGFAKEGLAKDYLKIAGRWEDHVLTALVNKKGLEK